MLYSITQNQDVVVIASIEDGQVSIVKGDVSIVKGYRFTSRRSGKIIKFDPMSPEDWEELNLATKGRSYFSCDKMTEDEFFQEELS